MKQTQLPRTGSASLCLAILLTIQPALAQVPGKQPVTAESSVDWSDVITGSRAQPELGTELTNRLEFLASELQAAEDASRAAAVTELLDILLDLEQAEDKYLAEQIAWKLFQLPTQEMEAEQAERVQRRAFGVLYKWNPERLAAQLRTVTLIIPDIACRGRFLDSLNEHVRNTQAWIFRISMESRSGSYDSPSMDQRTYQTALANMNPPNPWSSPHRKLQLKFMIRADHSVEELVQLLARTKRYSMEGWQVNTWVPVTSLVEKPPKDRN